MQRTLSITVVLAAAAGLSHALAQPPAQEPPAQEPPAQEPPAQEPPSQQPQPRQQPPAPQQTPQQQPQQQPGQEQPGARVPQVDVSEGDLDTFATIYVELQDKVEKYEERLAEAESQEEAQELQMQMREESLSAIEARGWSAEQFNRIAEAINANPSLSERVVALIEEKS